MEESSNSIPLEYECFSMEEVFRRWQSQPESDEQWTEMSEEMHQALAKENEDKMQKKDGKTTQHRKN